MKWKFHSFMQRLQMEALELQSESSDGGQDLRLGLDPCSEQVRKCTVISISRAPGFQHLCVFQPILRH